MRFQNEADFYLSFIKKEVFHYDSMGEVNRPCIRKRYSKRANLIITLPFFSPRSHTLADEGLNPSSSGEQKKLAETLKLN